jgi:hypothetical protein
MKPFLALLVLAFGATFAQTTLPGPINEVFVDTDTIVFQCDTVSGATEWVNAIRQSTGEELNPVCGSASAHFDDWLAVYNRTVEFDLDDPERVAWRFSVPRVGVGLYLGGFVVESVFYRFWVFEFSDSPDLLVVTDGVDL